MLIRNGEWIAIHPIGRAELALEVGCSEIIRCRRDNRHHAGMLMQPAPPPPFDQATTGQQLGGRTRGRPVVDLRMPIAQHPQQLSGAPVGMQAPELAEDLCDRRPNGRRTRVRPAAPVREPAASVLGKPREPLVADPAAHPIAGAQLDHAER